MDMIKNYEIVTEYFGYWPEFCDAKFTRFTFDKPGVIDATVFYIDADTKKQASIQIVFSGVIDVKLNDLRSENVIDEITVSDSSPYTVTIDACYGLNGSFKCADIEVANFST